MEGSNIIACDRGFGAHLTRCAWRSRQKSVQEFHNRDPRKKFFRGDNEDPLSFLKRVSKSVDDKTIKLPVIGYFRDAGFNPGTLDLIGRPITDILTLDGVDKEYPVKLSYLQFNYKVLVIGATKLDASEMGMFFYDYLKSNPYFMLKYKLWHQDEESGDGFVAEMKGRIMDPGMSGYNDAKAKYPNEDLPQFFASQADYDVEAPIFFMDKVEPAEEEVELLDITMI